MVTKRQIEKTTVYLLFSLFVQISAIEIRWVFSHTKLTISWLQWLEKKSGVPVLVGELEPFFNWESSISRQIRYVFNASLHERVLNDAINYAQKRYAMQLWGITLNWLTGKSRKRNPQMANQIFCFQIKRTPSMAQFIAQFFPDCVIRVRSFWSTISKFFH